MQQFRRSTRIQRGIDGKHPKIETPSKSIETTKTAWAESWRLTQKVTTSTVMMAVYKRPMAAFQNAEWIWIVLKLNTLLSTHRSKMKRTLIFKDAFWWFDVYTYSWDHLVLQRASPGDWHTVTQAKVWLKWDGLVNQYEALQVVQGSKQKKGKKKLWKMESEIASAKELVFRHYSDINPVISTIFFFFLFFGLLLHKH